MGHLASVSHQQVTKLLLVLVFIIKNQGIVQQEDPVEIRLIRCGGF